MIKEKDLNALKERVNNIDPIQTEGVVMFIGSPSDLQMASFGRDQAIGWILEAIITVVARNTAEATNEGGGKQ